MRQLQLKGMGRVLTQTDIDDLETATRQIYPAQYKQFLLMNNGGRPKENNFKFKAVADNLDGGIVDGFYGIDLELKVNNLDSAYKTYLGRMPKNIIPVAHDPFGNQICISVSGNDSGKVYFWDHEEEVSEGLEAGYQNLYLIADSFEEFLNQL